ncbi:MAG: hypothetical protein ACLSFZ_11520 [Frisingicoccus sp.]
MGKLKFAPYVFGLAAAVVFGTNPIGVQAAPVTTAKFDVSFGFGYPGKNYLYSD